MHRLSDLQFVDLHVAWPNLDRDEGPSITGLLGGPPWCPLRSMPHGAELIADVALLMGSVKRHLHEADSSTTDFSVQHDGIRYRASLIPGIGGDTFVFGRGLMDVPELAALQLPPVVTSALDAAAEAGGLILVIGPMGSGKTTVISATMRRWLESRGGVGYSLEDPAELRLDGRWGAAGRCYQRGVQNDDWSTPLRDMLRSRARFQMIGEIRSSTAGATALRMAINGGAVLTSIHGMDLKQGITALADYAVPSKASSAEALAYGLRAAVRVRLVASGHERRVVVDEALLIQGEGAAGIRAKLLERRFAELAADFVPAGALTHPAAAVLSGQAAIGGPGIALPPRASSRR